MVPGAAAAVARLNRAGVSVAVVTNQSVIGAGTIDQAMLDRIHDKLHAALAEAGAHLDALIVSPDPPGSTAPRRKPAPGMLREALAQFNATPGDTPMIGDSLRDMQAAAAAGCRRVLVRTGKGPDTVAAGFPPEIEPVVVFDDLTAVVDAYLAGSAALFREN